MINEIFVLFKNVFFFKKMFIDIDECMINIYDCYLLVICINIECFFICICNEGYMGDGRLCIGEL